MKIRILKDHREGCYAVKNFVAGDWNTPWAREVRSFFANINGVANGYYAWAVYRCNCSDCPAEVAVRTDDICQAIDAAIKATKPSRRGSKK